MSGQNKPVKLMILDKDYTVACPESERQNLLDCADYLSEKMRVVRESGKVMGTERILVMTALNIVHELLQLQQNGTSYPSDESSAEEIQQLIDKINAAQNKYLR